MMYYGFVPPDNRKFANVTKWLISAAAVYMAILGVAHRYWAFIILALIIIGVSFHRKEYVVSAAGVDIRDVFIVYRRRHIWRWPDVSSVFIDRKSKAPDVRLIFHSPKGNPREFIMEREDADAVIKLGRKMNPQIRILRPAEPDKAPEQEAAKQETPALQENHKISSEELAKYNRPDPRNVTIRKPSHKLKKTHY